jgi:hypothetical protein
MAASFETAKVRLVTIIAASELLSGIEAQLNQAGASGYTVMRADGRGQHGVVTAGFLGLGNVRVETLMGAADARKLMESLARDYAGRELMAFAHDVEAIPPDHFA